MAGTKKADYINVKDYVEQRKHEYIIHKQLGDLDKKKSAEQLNDRELDYYIYLWWKDAHKCQRKTERDQYAKYLLKRYLKNYPPEGWFAKLKIKFGFISGYLKKLKRVIFSDYTEQNRSTKLHKGKKYIPLANLSEKTQLNIPSDYNNIREFFGQTLLLNELIALYEVIYGKISEENRDAAEVHLLEMDPRQTITATIVLLNLLNNEKCHLKSRADCTDANRNFDPKEYENFERKNFRAFFQHSLETRLAKAAKILLPNNNVFSNYRHEYPTEKLEAYPTVKAQYRLLTEDEKAQHFQRLRKERFWRTLGRIAAVFVSFGCGCIAFMAMMPMGLGLAIACGVGGFLANLYLFSTSIPKTLVNLFVVKNSLFNGLHTKGLNKKSYPRVRKAAIVVSFAFALGTGLAYSLLTWNSAYAALGFTAKIGLLFHAGAALWLPYVFAAIICGSMLFGLTSIMFNGAASLIKTDLKTIRKTLKELFYPEPDEPLVDWKAKLRYAVKLTVNAIFTLAGVAIGFIAALALCGVMQGSAMKFSVNLFHATRSTGLMAAKVSSFIIAWIFNAPLRFIFSIKSNAKFMSFLGSGFTKLLTHPKIAVRAMGKKISFAFRNPKETLKAFFNYILVPVGIFFNAYGNAKLSEEGAGKQALKETISTNDSTSAELASKAGFLSSGGINTIGLINATKANNELPWTKRQGYFRHTEELSARVKDELIYTLFGRSSVPRESGVACDSEVNKAFRGRSPVWQEPGVTPDGAPMSAADRKLYTSTQSPKFGDAARYNPAFHQAAAAAVNEAAESEHPVMSDSTQAIGANA